MSTIQTMKRFKKTGFLIIARLKSTRLPNKILKKICGKSFIDHMIIKLKSADFIDNVIVCTSNLTKDQKLEKISKKNNINCFRGDPDDVIKRMYEASIKHNLKYILCITADCPLVDIPYAKKILKKLKNENFDLVRAFSLPHGAFCYGIRPKALKTICDIKNTKYTANWEKYFTRIKKFKVADLKIPKKHICRELRITLDYYEDFFLIRKIYKSLYKEKKLFNLEDILKLVRQNPKLTSINSFRSSDYIKNYKSETKLKLKNKFNHLKIRKPIYKEFANFIK